MTRHRSVEVRDQERATVATMVTAGRSPMAVAHTLNASFVRACGLVDDHYAEQAKRLWAQRNASTDPAERAMLRVAHLDALHQAMIIRRAGGRG